MNFFDNNQFRDSRSFLIAWIIGVKPLVVRSRPTSFGLLYGHDIIRDGNLAQPTIYPTQPEWGEFYLTQLKSRTGMGSKTNPNRIQVKYR